MKNHRTHITRFLIIVAMTLFSCHIGLTAGRTASAGSAPKATPLLPSLRGQAAIGHLKQTGLYHSLSAALTAARYQDEGAIYPVTIDPTFTQQQKLEASDAVRSDRLGSSVAISGETVVVGAPSDDGAAGEDQGSVYIFVRSGGVWSQQQKLEASDAAVDDLFGSSVAISGETVVVGAPFDDEGAGDNLRGSAYVFVRSGGVWSQQQKLEASDAAPFAEFGYSVAISGETVVVGARISDGPAGLNQGSAYVFVRSGGVWSQQQKLEASDAVASDQFGFSVAISGETVVVGAWLDAGAGGGSQGSAYVFVRSGGIWSQQQKLEASDAAAEDQFGYSVAIGGETVVVGAPFDDGAGGGSQGSAYVYVRSGGVWSQQQKLEAADAAAGDVFGYSVAISEETVVISARGDRGAAGFGQGSAYVFMRSGGVWSQQQKLEASDAAVNDEFGSSVAISGETVVAGAPFDDGAVAINQGSVYVFAPAN
jgi:FG-GAP repeat